MREYMRQNVTGGQIDVEKMNAGVSLTASGARQIETRLSASLHAEVQHSPSARHGLLCLRLCYPERRLDGARGLGLEDWSRTLLSQSYALASPSELEGDTEYNRIILLDLSGSVGQSPL